MILCDRKFISECDGGGAGGDCGGGPGGPGGDFGGPGAGPGGPGPCHGPGPGFMGPGCFHMPFPVVPAYYSRFAYSNPYRKGKKGKKRKYKNPYVAGMKVIQESADSSGMQALDALSEGVDCIRFGSLYPNKKLGLAWMLDENGSIHVFKPATVGKAWKICEMVSADGSDFCFKKSYGSYKNQADASKALIAETDRHLGLAIRDFQKICEARINPRELMKWIAQGKDPSRFQGSSSHVSVNTTALTAELNRRFPHQFNSVELSDKKSMDGQWRLEFKLPLPDGQHQIVGSNRVQYVIPQLRNIITFLRARGIEINSGNVKAVNG